MDQFLDRHPSVPYVVVIIFIIFLRGTFFSDLEAGRPELINAIWLAVSFLLGHFVATWLARGLRERNLHMTVIRMLGLAVAALALFALPMSSVLFWFLLTSGFSLVRTR